MTMAKGKKFEVGDEVIVSRKERKMRATVVLTGLQFGDLDSVLKVEDIDEIVHTVLTSQCRRVCSYCDGTGFYDGKRCKKCGGTGTTDD